MESFSLQKIIVHTHSDLALSVTRFQKIVEPALTQRHMRCVNVTKAHALYCNMYKYQMMYNAGKGPLWVDFHIFSF